MLIRELLPEFRDLGYLEEAITTVACLERAGAAEKLLVPET